MINFIKSLKFRLLLLLVLADLPVLLFVLYFPFQNISQSWAIPIGAILVGFGILCLGTKVILQKSVDQMIAVEKRIEKGDLSARVDLNSMTSELKDLAASINQNAVKAEEREAVLINCCAQNQIQAQQIVTMRNLGWEICSHQKLRPILQEICEDVIRTLNIHACSIRLYNPDQGDFALVAQSGLPELVTKKAFPLSMNAYRYHSIEEDIFVRLHEPTLDPILPDDLNEAKVGGKILSILMKQADSPIGLLNLYTSPGDTAPDSTDFQFFENVTCVVAVAVAYANLEQNYQQEQNKKIGLVKRMISIQEDERIHIARELHDVTSQDLSAIRVLLESINLSMADPSPKALGHIKSIRTIIDSIFDDTYRMISDLRPSILDDLGLEAAVSWFAGERLSPAGIDFQFKRENLECRLPLVIETSLFRIFQEAITNIVCHSKASFVDIFLSQDHDLAVLIVSDNGQGFDPSILKTHPSSCYGLTGISERVNSLDGKLQIISSMNNGTTLEISIPIQKGC